jgi:chorismate synthase
MKGFGRGRRMSIERDAVEILSGLRHSHTIGSPIAIRINNIDASIERLSAVLEPRPGHADLAGSLKYDHKDARNVLERASARDTASRVALGAVAKELLKEFNIELISHVVMIGGIEASLAGLSFSRIAKASQTSPVRCADPDASVLMCREIEEAAGSGDTLGGIFEVIAKGVPVGMGSYSQSDRRLDAVLAKAVMSIPAVKGVSFGMGFEAAFKKGSAVHDEIFYDRKGGFYRKTNNAGGIEGGVSNGEDIVMRAVMKPIATLKKALQSVNMRTKKASSAAVERSDTCAVPACGVVAECACALEIANAFLEKFGGDSLREIRRNYEGYMRQVRQF